MKHIIDFTKYNSYSSNPKWLMIEKFGIPNTLKELFDIVYDKVKNLNLIIFINYTSNDIVLKDLVIKIHKDSNDMYGTSTFGKKVDDYLQYCEINIFLTSVYDEEIFKKIIMHELLHIYEIFQRIKKCSNKNLQYELNVIIKSIEKKYSSKFIGLFTYLIYLSLDHEINARVAETYILLMNRNSENYSELKEYLEKTISWSYIKLLKNFNFEILDINYLELKNFLIELNSNLKNKLPTIKFNIYDIPKDKSDVIKILKKWTFLFKKKAYVYEEKLTKIILEVMNDTKMNRLSYKKENIDFYINNGYGELYTLIEDNNLKRKSKIFKMLRKI